MESSKEVIRELETKLLGALDVRRKMREKISEALNVEELEESGN